MRELSAASSARMEISIMQCAHEPLYDIDPHTGASIEVFYADRALETFGREGSGWFWWSRRPGFAPDCPATGPFATSYAAYRHAIEYGGPKHLPLTKRNRSAL